VRRGGREVLGRRGAREELGRQGARLVGWVVGSGCWGRRCWVLWTPWLVAAAEERRNEGDWSDLRCCGVVRSYFTEILEGSLRVDLQR